MDVFEYLSHVSWKLLFHYTSNLFWIASYCFMHWNSNSTMLGIFYFSIIEESPLIQFSKCLWYQHLILVTSQSIHNQATRSGFCHSPKSFLCHRGYCHWPLDHTLHTHSQLPLVFDKSCLRIPIYLQWGKVKQLQ